jgi:hypothetical protein
MSWRQRKIYLSRKRNRLTARRLSGRQVSGSFVTLCTSITYDFHSISPFIFVLKPGERICDLRKKQNLKEPKAALLNLSN